LPAPPLHPNACCRQVIHTEARLGQHKATSAAAAVAALNSSVAVVTHLEGLHPGNAVDIIRGYDVVLDASDNPPSRYLISDACVACGVPLVSAAAVGTDGQLTVYNHGPAGPCYRCLFPECPAPANCARCADAGVLGPVPGVLGVLQALEAVKLLSGCGDVLSGRLLLFDALAARFTSIKLRGKAPGCIACGPHPQITRDSIATYDYTAFTGGQRANDGAPAPLKVLPPEQRITPLQLRDMLQPAGRSQAAAEHQQEPEAAGNAEEGSPAAAGAGLVLLDVRPLEQFAVMALPGAVNVPFLKLEQQLADVLQLCGAEQQQEEQQPSPSSSGLQQAGGSGAKQVVVMCRRGNHSQLAVRRLRELGVAAVDVGGGYEAWAAEVDASMPVL
jgi:adenylyltransferase/sulfurtransferase